MSDRNRQLAQLHTIKRDQRLTDDDYRDKLERITGKRSAADLSEVELSRAIQMFHGKQNANQSYTALAKALWIAAFNLGAMTNGSDRALDAFVERQTGKERLGFLTAAEANAVSEALKAMCARFGFVVPKNDQGGKEARVALLRAQWARLAALGQVHLATHDALSSYVSKKYLFCHGTEHNLTPAMADDCARAFGRWIRKAQQEQAAG